ncbi:MAG: hypothetical protein ACLGSA_12485 [Acidobacteriota bacterium]
MKKFVALVVLVVSLLATTNAFAISAAEVYEKMSRLDSLLSESRVSRVELSRAYAEAKAAEDSYSLNHKDKLMGQFALVMAQFGAAKAVLEAGQNDLGPLLAAKETMKKIRGMIRGK